MDKDLVAKICRYILTADYADSTDNRKQEYDLSVVSATSAV